VPPPALARLILLGPALGSPVVALASAALSLGSGFVLPLPPAGGGVGLRSASVLDDLLVRRKSRRRPASMRWFCPVNRDQITTCFYALRERHY